MSAKKVIVGMVSWVMLMVVALQVSASDNLPIFS